MDVAFGPGLVHKLAEFLTSDSSMPFIRSESCSFIWHPKVVTW